MKNDPVAVRRAVTLSTVVVLMASLWASSAAAQPKNDRLRIATLNAALLISPAPEKEMGDQGGNLQRATTLAQTIPLYDYDVVVFNEVFDEEAARKLAYEGLAEEFPYYITGIRSDGLPTLATGGLEPPTLASSGLAIFSKWPFETVPRGCRSSGTTHDLMDPITDRLSTPTWDNTNPITPFAFRRFAHCYWEGLTVKFWELGDKITRNSDCLASKGVGYVRVKNPDTHRRYHIFFTHPQASYSGGDADLFRTVRTSQLNDIKQLATCVNLESVQGNEPVVVLGDLNIDGSQNFNNGVPLFSEWETHFYRGEDGTSPADHFFSNSNWRTAVKDSWVYDMNNGWWLAPDLFDLGHTMKTERLDYIFFGPSQTTPDRRGTCLQHTTRAYNLLAQHAGGDEGGITNATSPGTSMLRGVAPLSDHMGLSAEINVEGERCNPTRSLLIHPVQRCEDNYCQNAKCSKTQKKCFSNADCNECLGNEPGSLVAPGFAQWYRIDDPGTYTFRVNTKDNINPNEQLDNGLRYIVYLPSDISQPLEPFGVSTTESDPPGLCEPDLGRFEGCPYEGLTYLVPSAPFYVKVYSETFDPSSPNPYGTEWPLDYTFSWQKSNCESAKQACALYPTMVHDGQWAKNMGDKAYFQLYIDRADSGFDQALRFDAAVPPGEQRIAGISVLNETEEQIALDKTPLAADGHRFQLFSENIAPSPAESVGRLDGDQQLHYLVVHRNSSLPPEAFNYTVRWDTSLTWIHGTTHSWPAGVDWGLNLYSNTEDDSLFGEVHDEIRLRYAGDDRQYACFGGESNCLGVWQHRFGNKDGPFPIKLAAGAYAYERNAYSELIRTRNAFRFVTRFQMEVMEVDEVLGFGNEVSGVGTFAPFTPADSLGPGVPDPSTANTLIKSASSNSSLYLESDEGHYKAEVYLAGSVPVVFCIDDPTKCGDSGSYCCDTSSRVCLPNEPDASGFCQ